jgi:hypothetical protein
VVVGFGLGGRDVADRAEQASVVVPVDPVHRGDLDRRETAPGSLAMDHLGLEQADHGFGERIVVAVADAADRGVDAGFDQALGVLDRDLLGRLQRSSQQLDEGGCDDEEEAALGQICTRGSAHVDRLLERVEHELGARGPTRSPADDTAGEHVDGERDVDHARPGRDVGEVAHPLTVSRRSIVTGRSWPGDQAAFAAAGRPADQFHGSRSSSLAGSWSRMRVRMSAR